MKSDDGRFHDDPRIAALKKRKLVAKLPFDPARAIRARVRRTRANDHGVMPAS
jgi:hypothetical protein